MICACSSDVDLRNRHHDHALAYSFELYNASIPENAFPREVPLRTSRVPKNVTFVDKWGPAIDSENKCFQKYDCFRPVPSSSLPPCHHTLPDLWILRRKQDHTAKTRSCVGSHSQMLVCDYFLNKNYCAVLSSCDNCILFVPAAVEGWTIY